MRKPKDATTEGFDIRDDNVVIEITYTLTAGQEMDQSDTLRQGDFVTLRKEKKDVLVDSIQRSDDTTFIGEIRSFPGYDKKTIKGTRLGDIILFDINHVFSIVRTINLGPEL
jgi:hypothetical protein